MGMRSDREPGPPGTQGLHVEDMEDGVTKLVRRVDYKVGKRLGAGGFAEIYEAQTASSPGSPSLKVALKRLLPGLRKDPLRRRHLIREAQLSAQLHHPNIVRVLDLVDLGDEPAIVMELVEGISASHLLQRLAQRSLRLSLGAVSHIMEGLLSALLYLEGSLGPRPLVHADISLENLMVTGNGQVKLVDFGIAGLDPRSEPEVDDEGVTSIHQAAGKRSYAPPEAQKGVPSLAGDLYAAGVCFWELLSGCRFPVLPAGVGNRELGSLIAFAAQDLPEGVWTTLQLSLSLDPSIRPGSAARCRELMQAASVAASFSTEALGCLVSGLLSGHLSPSGVALASEPADLMVSLVERLYHAFSAERVMAYEPVPPGEVDDLDGHEYILRAEWGQGGGTGGGSDVADSLLRQAEERGYLSDEEGGLLLCRTRPPGMKPHVLVVQPAAGCFYDSMAQQIFRSLLTPEGGAPAI